MGYEQYSFLKISYYLFVAQKYLDDTGFCDYLQKVLAGS